MDSAKIAASLEKPPKAQLNWPPQALVQKVEDKLRYETESWENRKIQLQQQIDSEKNAQEKRRIQQKLIQEEKKFPNGNRALKNLIDPDNIELKNKYRYLVKKHPQEAVVRFLEEVIDIYFETGMYEFVRKPAYTDWLVKIAEKSEELSVLLMNPPSGDWILPSWISNADTVLEKLMFHLGDDMSIEQYQSIPPYLKHKLKQIPVRILTDVIFDLACSSLPQKATPSPQPEDISSSGSATLLNSQQPQAYWEKEYQIDQPVKVGEDGQLGHEQVITKRLRQLIQRYFKQHYHELIAVLMNALTNTDKFDRDRIRKLCK